MSTHAETINMTEGFGTYSCNSDNPSQLIPINVSKKQLLSWLLLFVEAIVEYSCGMYMGAAIGWLFGWCAGDVYVEHFKPVYFSDFSGLNEIVQWSQVPYEFAWNGKLIGAVAGAIVIMVLNSRLLTQRIISLYEKEVIDPEDIARALGKNVRQIQRKINKLAKKGKTDSKKVNSPERLPI